jgi:hypothetical protein
MAGPIALSNYKHIRTVKMGGSETKTPKDIVGEDDPSLWDLLGIVGTTEAGVLLLGRRPDPKPKSKGLTAEEIARAQNGSGR